MSFRHGFGMGYIHWYHYSLNYFQTKTTLLEFFHQIATACGAWNNLAEIDSVLFYI